MSPHWNGLFLGAAAPFFLSLQALNFWTYERQTEQDEKELAARRHAPIPRETHLLRPILYHDATTAKLLTHHLKPEFQDRKFLVSFVLPQLVKNSHLYGRKLYLQTGDPLLDQTLFLTSDPSLTLRIIPKIH